MAKRGVDMPESLLWCLRNPFYIKPLIVFKIIFRADGRLNDILLN